MTSRLIKWLAIILMTVDHAGLMLCAPGTELYEVLRSIGRLSYPLFAFLIAYGCLKTRSKAKYFLRLIAFAVWLHIGAVVLNIEVLSVNIFYTLAFGTLGIIIIDKLFKSAQKVKALNIEDKVVLTVLSVCIASVISVTGGLLRVDYGAPGVALIIMFYGFLKLKSQIQNLLKNAKPKNAKQKNQTIVLAALQIFGSALALLAFNGLYHTLYITESPIQWYSMLSFIPLSFFADRYIRINRLEKYFFYLYYPLHFGVLFLIASVG